MPLNCLLLSVEDPDLAILKPYLAWRILSIFVTRFNQQTNPNLYVFYSGCWPEILVTFSRTQMLRNLTGFLWN